MHVHRGSWRFPTCRGSDGCMTHAQPRARRGAARSGALGGGRGDAARNRRPAARKRGIGRPVQTPTTRSISRPLRRHALRAGGAGAHRRAPARRSPRSRRCWPSTARCSPSSRRISGRCFGGAARTRHDRRRARLRTSPARAASRRARRATISSASRRCPAAARRSSPAAGWSRTSPATICPSCWPAPGARWPSLTEVTFKVLPAAGDRGDARRARRSTTDAVDRALARRWARALEVAGAAHLPEAIAAELPDTSFAPAGALRR